MSAVLKPTFQGEMMLAGWKDSHNGGCVVSFWLPDRQDLECFRGLTAKKGDKAGQRFMAVLVEIPDGEIQASDVVGVEAAGANTAIRPDEPRAAGNQLARKLHVDGYFRAPRFWLAMHDSGLYTAQAHFKWLAKQGCVRLTVEDFGCTGDVVTHHCNAASAIDGGKRQPEAPQKPLHYWGLPLCHAHHTWAHSSTGADRAAKEWLLEQAVALTAAQMKVAMKRYLQIDSLREITPAMLADFERVIGL